MVSKIRSLSLTFSQGFNKKVFNLNSFSADKSPIVSYISCDFLILFLVIDPHTDDVALNDNLDYANDYDYAYERE